MTTISDALAVAQAHLQAGRFDEAESVYRQIVETAPGFAHAWNLRAVLAAQRGQYPLAEDCLRRAITLEPEVGALHGNLGGVLHAQKKWNEAIASYQRAISLDPLLAETHHNLGAALVELGRSSEAIASLRRAIELKPDASATYHLLARALQDSGSAEEGINTLRRAIAINSADHQACFQLGNLLLRRAEAEAAETCYRRVLELRPDYAEAYYNLGNALKYRDRPDEVATCFRHALALRPDDPGAAVSLVFEQAQMCDWTDLIELSQRVIGFVDRNLPNPGASAVPPFEFLTLPVATTCEQQLRAARQWVAAQFPSAPQRPPAPVAPPVAAQPKITEGYLSADFYSHATAALIVELFEKHDRTRFNVLGYSYGHNDGSRLRRRLEAALDQTIELKHLPPRQAAQRIAADQVDILIDLKGYTADARTEITALRPAPIQVNYLGYPGTMGAPFIDYILVDEFIVPQEMQPCFSEKLVHLPGCYQVNDRQRAIAPVTPSRSDCGLPDEGFVFCSFNSNYKITPEVFSVWMKLLAAVPGSVLWLLAGNRFVETNLCREAVSRGIAPARLVFAPRLPPEYHLARHRLADLILDTYPVNAHTTASEALWAGCPLVTLAGKTFVSRVAGSLLKTIGLEELITTGLTDYYESALRLATHPSELAAVRTRLVANRETSTLFDATTFARHVERAYATMYEIHRSGQPPRAFKVHA
jgi:predicted O-linked N-acetylglucosamine transferase (SPINDLY family)